jgi:hypothetical protein
MRIFVLQVLCLLICLAGNSQTKSASATRSSSTIKIDGILDETDWSLAVPATDFITNSPVYGKPSQFPTEVKVIYDNSAIYIGAYIHDDPSKIRRQFTARDQVSQADVDYFSVFIDTYKDRQNAFQFLVTSRNVQADARVSPTANTGFGVYGDQSWDAVWESKVGFRPDGWIVEIKIPYFSLRFSKEEIQQWGIQFLRFSRRFNESSFWNPVNPAVNGFVNQFGELVGLENLRSPLRLSLSPYVSGGYRNVPYEGRENSSEWLRSGGMDLKYGINESFTLDATLIPDFGQVISDNVINNITPFEIQFKENRPFFTEGTELFNKAGIFYSRRVGRTPERYYEINNLVNNGGLPDYSIVRNPSVTRLYNAMKLSGRTKDNLGIGIFNAIGQPVKAKLRNTINGKDTLILTEETTNYNVFVLDQALKNRSYITLTNTNVLRNGHAQDANVTALDVAVYDKKNRYGFTLNPRYSKIFGREGGYEGFSNRIGFGKVSGNFQFNIENNIETPKYSPNDLGFLLSPNEFSNFASVAYRVFNPTKYFINQNYGIEATQSYLYKPFEYQKTEISAYASWVFHNFWDLTVEGGTAPIWNNDFFELQTPQNILETPRKKLRRAPYYFLFLRGSSDSRKKWFASWNIGGAEGPLSDDPYYRLDFSFRYRFSDRFSLEASYSRQYDNGQFGYAFFRDMGEPVLARRKYTDVSNVITGIYNFTSRMNLTFRARHFWNKLDNTNLYNVLDDGNWTERFDLVPSNYNSTYNAFNLDVFYTWDFRLGSRIILGYKNWLGEDFANVVSLGKPNRYLHNINTVFINPHGNEVTLRFIYFLDSGEFRRKR